MRYRLRTLLIGVTACCTFFAWAAYLRRTAEHHRQEASRIAADIADVAFMPDDFAKEAVEIYAAQGIVPRTNEEEPGYAFVAHPSYGRQLVLVEKEKAKWDRAVHHHKMAAFYDRAILRPWTFISSKPVP